MKKLTRVEKKKRRRKIFLRIMFSIFLILLVFILLFKTGFFLINNIDVSGNKKTLYKTIVETSNIEKNDNILQINLKDSKKKIEKLPYVKEVEIKRKFPKSVLIKILERKEVLQVEDNLSFIIIDEEGYILNIVEDVNEDLPVLVGLELGEKTLGDNFLLDIEEINVEFLKEGQAVNLLSSMEEISILEDKNINLSLFNGIKVAFGTIDNVKYKLNLLKEVLKDIEEKELECKTILMDRGENPIIVLEDEEG